MNDMNRRLWDAQRQSFVQPEGGLYSQEDTNASYTGKKGGLAWLVDKTSGRKMQELRLDAVPTWDGIAIAHGHYFISLKDGSVVCLAGREQER